MKKLLLLLLKIACLFLGFSLLSCSNIFKSEEVTEKAYICVKDAGIKESARTVMPSANQNDLRDLVLKGTKAGASEQTLANADSFSGLSSSAIEIESGSWNFTLSASLNGVAFSGTSSANVRAGRTIPLSFDLSTSQTKGGFSIQVFFEGEADLVGAYIQNSAASTYYNTDGSVINLQEIVQESDTYTELTIRQDSQNHKYVTLDAPVGENSGFDEGFYRIKIAFTRSELNSGIVNWLNSYETSVKVLPGFISKATVYMNLSELYSVTLHLNGGTFAGQPEVFNTFFSRKEGPTLPNSDSTPSTPSITKSGYTFAGWYAAEDCTGNAVTEVPAGSRGSLEYWAKWEEVSGAGGTTIYVTNGGSSSNSGLSENSPLGSITDAVSKIAALVDSNEHSADENWNICLLSDIDDGQSVGSELNGKAARVTILSKSADDIKSIDYEVDDSNNKYVNLTIDTSVSIELKDINIVNNAYASGSGNNGGLLIKSGSVTMQSGEISGNTDCGVVICNGASFYMKGGSVKNNAYENLQGQVIYKEIENFGDFYMSGGTVGGDNGGTGVFVYNDGSFTMSGNARIVPDNVVVLSSGTVLTIGGSLTGTTPVATITPYSYEPNRAWLSLDPDSETSLAAEYSKFAVAPEYDPGADEFINYVFDENGYVQPENSGGGGTSTSVTYYISPTGNDSYDGLSESNAIATVQHLAEDLMTNEDTDYIINVCGDMTSGSESEWLLKNIAGAKSITIQGNGNSNSGNKLPGVYTKSKAPITFKNIQIGAMYIDAVQIDEDSCAHADVILDTGTLIQNNSSITSIDDNGLYGVVHLYKKGAVTLTMKSGAVISNNTYVDENAEQYGACGGVYIGQYSTFIMEGGTISGNAEYDVSNCQDGYFIVSGDAQAGKVYCKALDSADSRSTPIYIGGPLTSSTVATITPYFYTDWQALELGNDEDGNPITTTTIGAECGKFAVTPSQMVNYIVNESGMLQEVSSGGGGTSGIVVTSNAGGSGMATILSSNDSVVITISNDDETIDFTKLKIKVGSTEYVSDSLRNFVTTGTTDNENSYEFSFGSSLTSTGTDIEIYYNGALIETLSVMRRTNAG